MSELKGALIIGQSGGPTAVINSSALGVIATGLDNPNITRVLGAANGIRGVLEDRLYDMSQEDRAELDLLLQPEVVERGEWLPLATKIVNESSSAPDRPTLPA